MLPKSNPLQAEISHAESPQTNSQWGPDKFVSFSFCLAARSFSHSLAQIVFGLAPSREEVEWQQPAGGESGRNLWPPFSLTMFSLLLPFVRGHNTGACFPLKK